MQGLTLLFAVLVLLWLVNIGLHHPDGWLGGSLEGALGFGTWIAIGLVLLFLLFATSIILMDPIYGMLFTTVVDTNLLHPKDSLTIGCPACGTVFDLKLDEMTEDVFACLNCGREGVIRDHTLKKTAIQEEACTTCGHHYQEFQEFSECPKCHTYNEY